MDSLLNEVTARVKARHASRKPCCLVYATAAKAGLALSQAAFSQREDELRTTTTPKKPRQAVFKSRWVEEGPEPW
jgi:hypothetical protein